MIYTKKLTAMACLCICLGATAAMAQDANGPYQATGFKAGEVTESAAIIWTRLTQKPQRAGSDAPMPKIMYRNPDTGRLIEESSRRPNWDPVVEFPDGSDIDRIEGATPGVPGAVRVLYKPADSPDWQTTEWAAVDPDRDFTRQFRLEGLLSDTRYKVRVESHMLQTEAPGQALEGGFRTAIPAGKTARVAFTVTTCHEYLRRDNGDEGFLIYPAMAALDPHFFVHTGDIVYYDRMAKTLPLARWHWARIYSLPAAVAFHRGVSSYFIKDDHDTWLNDCWPGMQTRFMGEFTFEQGQAVFLEQVPMGDSTYRTFRWGKDLQIWLVEGRDFRSPNDMPDGPGKTIWGAEQKEWFKRTVMASDASFRVLISPNPLVGPDRENKNDNHANKGFTHEGNELREFLAARKNMIVIHGDRHWQYASVDARTGLREYSCGAASDEHAGGWKQDDVRPEHRYLNVVGGFLSVTVDRDEDGAPFMLLRHHDVNGKVLFEDRVAFVPGE